MDKVLLPAVDAGVVLEANAVLDAPVEGIDDIADELADALDTDKDDGDAAAPLDVPLPPE